MGVHLMKVVSVALIAFGAVVFLLGGAAFWDRYWRVRHCFNDLGRCYDETRQEVLLEQAGVAWTTVAVGGLALIVAGSRRLYMTRLQS